MSKGCSPHSGVLALPQNPRASNSTRKQDSTQGGWEYTRTGGRTKVSGEDQGLTVWAQSEERGVGPDIISASSSLQLPRRDRSVLWQVLRQEVMRRRCSGNRQTDLSLIPAERLDDNTVCRQGNPERGIPPGKTLCWTRARAANTCERVNSKMHSHRFGSSEAWLTAFLQKRSEDEKTPSC